MKISIITSVFNNKSTITEAIASVLSQTFPNIEYIIIDGGSTDGTMEIVRSYQDQISIIVSESDTGIYDGLNKGIKRATGDVIGFLHSDDIYQDNQVIEKVARVFNEHPVQSVYGDLTYVQKQDSNKVIRYWKAGEFSNDNLGQGWMPPHPTFFVKREIYERFGVFDTRFRIAADYDLILRFLGKRRVSTYYISEVFIKMRVGGASNQSLKNIWKKSVEDYRALKQNGVGGISSLFLKNVSKIHQFWSR